MSLTTTAVGVGIAGTGVAHFLRPDVFESMTRTAFPEDTETWVFRDGMCETAIGLAIALPPTRKIGVLGLLGYVGWLGYNVARNR